MLRVQTTGGKQWIWRGTIHGQHVNLGLGGWPYVSLNEAPRRLSTTESWRGGAATLARFVPASVFRPSRTLPRRSSRFTSRAGRTGARVPAGGGRAPGLRHSQAREAAGQRYLDGRRHSGRARWDEVDLKTARGTVPADRMKMRCEHRVPLSERALQILSEAREWANGSGLIFPSVTGRPLSDPRRLVALVVAPRLRSVAHAGAIVASAKALRQAAALASGTESVPAASSNMRGSAAT